MKKGKFRQGKIPTYSRASVDESQADRGIAALKLQMKELLGTKYRRENFDREKSQRIPEHQWMKIKLTEALWP